MRAGDDSDVDAAARSLAGNARVLDRHRVERLFFGGYARPVRDAIAAFRNSDGGFGHALEPDGRTPASQPAAVAMALGALDEADAWDEELVAGACAWLAANAPAEGGASFVEPTVKEWPHASWWEPEEGQPASLFTARQIAATLHARRVEHRWLDGATDLLWRRIDGLDDPGPYGFRGVLKFLEHVPDRGRAEQAFERVGRLLFDRGRSPHPPYQRSSLSRPPARRRFDLTALKGLRTHAAADSCKWCRMRKSPVMRGFAESSSGLEPETLSVPFAGRANWPQPTAMVFACLSRFRRCPICYRLRPLGSNKRSMPRPRALPCRPCRFFIATSVQTVERELRFEESCDEFPGGRGSDRGSVRSNDAFGSRRSSSPRGRRRDVRA
jgi:hypothetical protein